MKLRNLLITLGLTLTVGAGVVVATGAKQNEEPKAAEAADGTEVDRAIYVAIADSTLSNAGADHVRTNSNIGDGGTYRQRTLTKTGHTYKGKSIWSGTTVEKYGGVDELQIQLYNGSTWKAQKVPYSSYTKYGTYTGKIYVYDSGSWVNYSTDPYRIKCGTGSYVEMPYDDGGGLPSGVIGQFSATLNITAGQSLTIQKNTGSWGDISPSYSGDSNNYSGGQVLVSVTSAQIWLKYKSDGTYDVWVPGYTSCAVIVGGTQYTTTTEGDDEVTNLIYIEKDQTVTVSWAHTPIPTYLNGGSTSGCFSGDGGTVTCLLTGAYIVKVCYNSYHTEKNDVYIERNNASTAKYLAQKFNNTISSICSAITGGSKSLSDLQAAWGSNSSSDLYKHFNGQPSTIIAYFGTSSGTTDSDILACVARYDYIERKYGTDALKGFLGRNNSYPATAQNHILISLFGQSGGLNSSIIVIVVIASLGLLSVGGYYFFRKSRKSEE